MSCCHGEVPVSSSVNISHTGTASSPTVLKRFRFCLFYLIALPNGHIGLASTQIILITIIINKWHMDQLLRFISFPSLDESYRPIGPIF